MGRGAETAPWDLTRSRPRKAGDATTRLHVNWLGGHGPDLNAEGWLTGRGPWGRACGCMCESAREKNRGGVINGESTEIGRGERCIDRLYVCVYVLHTLGAGGGKH